MHEITDGSTEALARSIAEGATSSGATVRLRRAREVADAQLMKSVPGWFESAKRMNDAYEAPTEEDAEWADGIIIGTPTRFGSVSAELKA
jgi:NAD(P)H dehydrogenase (quinone)